MSDFQDKCKLHIDSDQLGVCLAGINDALKKELLRSFVKNFLDGRNYDIYALDALAGFWAHWARLKGLKQMYPEEGVRIGLDPDGRRGSVSFGLDEIGSFCVVTAEAQQSQAKVFAGVQADRGSPGSMT